MSKNNSSPYQLIFIVFIALVVLTGVEYAVSQVTSSTAILMILAFLKAALIVNYFMHVYRLWREEEH